MRGLVLTKDIAEFRYEADRVSGAGEELGQRVELLFYENFRLVFSEGQVKYFYEDKVFHMDAYDWCYPRTAFTDHFSLVDMKTILLSDLMRSGVRVLNGTTLLEYPKLSKLRQYHLFTEAGLPVVTSEYVPKEKRDYTTQFPMIVKGLYGSRGDTVYKADDKDELSEILLQNHISQFLFQVRLMAGYDYRVLVLDKTVLGVMKRTAPKDSHLSNYSRGGRVESVPIEKDVQELALGVVDALDLEYAGVDIMRNNEGDLVLLEVNRHAQFKGFEKATGVNVAKRVVEYLVRKSR